ncbi:MAG: oligosaccharide flippase family protein [Cytophagales bacterium]|jgi:O-antigen/teichoic acid export membrane protein|nr:oligosaccharide flippase family protein [Cytophagales bacterium]MCA6369591.1 oligosaccharide flippase family protein [Cytophagales bacterium]MCA6370695.1 oligosaccharide flippase family protein [Cytophagales bacterium]MCA6377123.1 oligosaccharide flippase family protein [Cytophagales bacterium]MCA6383776.1 oligosaccharide flippase family protein [Cytophagales bacterium]
MKFRSAYFTTLAAVKENKFIARFLFTTDQRGKIVRNNIVYSFLFKILGTLLSLFLVPLTLGYLNPTKYGVWLTLSAVISWITIFDVGLGSGLRNKLAEAFAKDDKIKARTYVSTTYAILGIITCLVYVLFLVFDYFIDWALLLNVNPELSDEVNSLTHLVFIFFLFRLVSGLITSILTADQRLAAVGFLELLTNFFSVLAIILLPYFFNNSLLWVGASMSFITFFVPVVASLYYFNSRYKFFSPAFTHVNFKFFRDLMNLSFDFFVLSISTIIIYFSQNLIISHLFGPAEVSTFNIAYKYFFYIIVIHVLILNPMIPASTEAYYKSDLGWIKKILQKLIYLWIVIVVIIVIMVLMSEIVYKLWIGEQIFIPLQISLSMGAYVIIFTWYCTFVYLINGIGKIKLQLYVLLIASFFIIPISIFFVKRLNFGVDGVIMAGLICTIPGSIIMPIQLNKLLNNKAKGIWNK